MRLLSVANVACTDGQSRDCFTEAVALSDNERFGWGLDPEALRGAIHWHHKVCRYRGPHVWIIVACRKADWIDASKGLVRKGISESAIAEVEAAFPQSRVSRRFASSKKAGSRIGRSRSSRLLRYYERPPFAPEPTKKG